MSLADWTKWVQYSNREDGDITLDQLTGEEYTHEELARLYIEADSWANAANKVKAVIASALLPVADEPLEIDGWLVWRGKNKKEVCVDPEGFSEWLGKNPELAVKLFNPNSVRFGALPPAARETFYEKQTYGKVEVQAAPLQVIEDAKQRRSG